MLTLSPDKQSLLLFSSQPIQLKTRSAWVLVAGTQRNFLTSLVKVGYSSLLFFHHPRGSSSLSKEGSFLNLPGENETFFLQICLKPVELSFHRILLLALFVRLIKVQEPPLGLVLHLFSWRVGLLQGGHLTLEPGEDEVSFMPLDHL